MTLLAVAVAVLIAAGAMTSTALAATTITVNTTSDQSPAGDGKCSLREATVFANGTPESDCALSAPSGATTIVVPANANPYALTAGPLTLMGNASIQGAGAATTTITAGGASQVLLVKQGAVVGVSGITVTGGQSPSVCTNPLCVGARLPSSGAPGGGIANDGALTLTGVTVTGNRTGAGALNGACFPPSPQPCSGGFGGDGGGISNSTTGVLTIVGSTIIGNSTGTGAAGQPGPPGENPGGSGNAGNGGGIFNAGTLTIKASTIADNTAGDGPTGAPGAVGATGGNASNAGAGGSGGGIESSGPLFISGSTLVGNRTGAGGPGGLGGNGTNNGGFGTGGGPGGSGGAIDSSGDLTITNSTIVANSASGGGVAGMNGTPSGPGQPGPGLPGTGGAINERAMGATLTHVTITANSAGGVGGGIDGAGGTVTVGNSIIAGNVATPPNLNCAGVLVDQGGNIEFAASSCPAGFLRANPKLTGLADNGGPTQTVAIQSGSAAIGHVRTCVLVTDQRGVARPVGSACDSGAYQVAPPSLSGVSATPSTTTTAAIAAAINPNLQDTTVVVNYGRTSSYGSSTTPRDLGAGNAPTSFSAALSGLVPGATYHFDVVATNADGQTTTGDEVFTALPPLTASIAGATTTGPMLSLTIACAGGSGPGGCAGTIRLTSQPPSTRAHVAKGKRGAGATVGGGSYSVPSGGRVRIKIGLNRKGRMMLTQSYVLATTLSMRGTTRVTRNVTFRYPVIQSLITWALNFPTGSSAANLSQLTAQSVPHGGRVSITCQGGGCPFSARVFAPRNGQVSVGRIFQQRPLRVGVTIQIEVLAANRVGKVDILGIRSGQTLSVSRQCLPPGAARPARCANVKH